MQRSSPRSNHLRATKGKLNTVENGRNNEADDADKSSEKAEEEKEEDIHL